MRKIIAASLTAVMLFAMTACSKEPKQTTEAPTATTAAATAATEAETEAAETTLDDVYYAPPAWEGYWKATDSDENFEISGVTDDGFKMVYFHYEEGTIEQFNYDIEFDNPEKTIASEIGSANDHGGWEYTFNFQGDTILVQFKTQEQVYTRAEKPAEET